MNEEAATIVRAVLGLGHGLGLPVLAEGVETPGELKFLTEEHCTDIHGFLLGKPAEIETLRAISLTGSQLQAMRRTSAACRWKRSDRRPHNELVPTSATTTEKPKSHKRPWEIPRSSIFRYQRQQRRACTSSKCPAYQLHERPRGAEHLRSARVLRKIRQLPRQLLGLEGAPEWPRIAALMPDLAGLEVVDLGCGMGWFTRWAAEHGAARVVGIDLSEKMIEEARARTPPSSIQYRLADLEHLRPLDGSFDFAYSSLAFHYVEDFKKLANQALREGSFFLFTIEHPIFMAARNPRWVSVDSDHRSWIVDSYAVEGERHTD